MTARTLVCSMILTLFTAGGACVQQEVLLTEPCIEGCNEAAELGATCASAEDCALEQACNLAFPGGYCQGFCEEGALTGAACGSDAGICMPTLEGEHHCLDGCDAGTPSSCEREGFVCYPVTGTETAGICHLQCFIDSECGEGQGCDGQGLCRFGTSACDALSNAGCPEGMGCYMSAQGQFFCGLSGPGRLGEACATTAGCTEGLWCIEGQCQQLCEVRDLTACGNLPALCRPILRGQSLGFCRR